MKRRSGEAMAALGRKAGPMRHRLEPRGGAKNEFQDYQDELEPEEEEMIGKAVYTVEFSTQAAAQHVVASSVQKALEWAQENWPKDTVKAVRETIPYVYIAPQKVGI